MPQEAISDRYELLEELSHGGMGDVWRGYDAVLDRPVTVKLIRQASVTSPPLAEEFAKRFRREARITARIQHPGVPQVYDAMLDSSFERLFLVMELVDGEPLSAYIRPGKPLPVTWAAAVAAQIATVLSYAHEVPVIHRDLKPGNILVGCEGTVKVFDFCPVTANLDRLPLNIEGRQFVTAKFDHPGAAHGTGEAAASANRA